jgi:DNA-binding NtrC family response regulator
MGEADDLQVVGNIEAALAGYVTDNMEGAVDQAAFLAGVDIPIAIIGARGTGKMYVAKLIHKESGGNPGDLLALDCKELRGRNRAAVRVQKALLGSEGKTLVFKAPHLLPAQVQRKLARQLATRIQGDIRPPRYLPKARYIAIFTDTLEELASQGSLTESLASVFAGYPIHIPPMYQRKQAVLRWAAKILAQELTHRDVCVNGFTQDAEKAMLGHHWRGNITEIRERVVHALSTTSTEWIRPVDLGLVVKEPDRTGRTSGETGYLASMQREALTEPYHASVEDELSRALGARVIQQLRDKPLPVGQWLVDDILLASELRYSGNVRLVARFLRENTRNTRRWLARAHERDKQRESEQRWSECHSLVQEWVRESAVLPYGMIQRAEDMLLDILRSLESEFGATRCAAVLGVSRPTYKKRVSERLLALKTNNSRS